MAEEPQTLRLRFSNGTSYDYKVETFNLLAHSAAELERRGLAILLPFCILKLRKRVKAAKPGAERQALVATMRRLLEELANAVEGSRKGAHIEEADIEALESSLRRLYDELYGQYGELAKETDMERILKLDIDIIREDTTIAIARNLLADGLSPERVARNTGLSLRKVKSLLKSAPVKKTADA